MDHVDHVDQMDDELLSLRWQISTKTAFLKSGFSFAQGCEGQGGRQYTGADVSAFFSREKKFFASPRFPTCYFAFENSLYQ